MQYFTEEEKMTNYWHSKDFMKVDSKHLRIIIQGKKIKFCLFPSKQEGWKIVSLLENILFKRNGRKERENLKQINNEEIVSCNRGEIIRVTSQSQVLLLPKEWIYTVPTSVSLRSFTFVWMALNSNKIVQLFKCSVCVLPFLLFINREQAISLFAWRIDFLFQYFFFTTTICQPQFFPNSKHQLQETTNNHKGKEKKWRGKSKLLGGKGKNFVNWGCCSWSVPAMPSFKG